MNELQTWFDTSVVRTIQQLKESSRGASRGDDNVQILLNVLDGRKPKSTTVAHQGEENLQLRNEVGDREPWLNQWYDFCKQVCAGGWAGWGEVGGIYYQVDEQIQVLGPHVHQDIVDKLDNGCGIFREELGLQLSRIKDVQGDMYQ